MKRKTGSFETRAEFLDIDPEHPDPAIIQQAGRVIRAGGVVVFPARCLYGLGVDALNPPAVKRLFEIKRRPPTNPILVLIRRRDDLRRLVADVPDLARKIMDRFWPGGVTLVFRARPDIPAELTAGTGKIGVRLCGTTAASDLIAAAGGPITGTSANISGTSGCADIAELDPRVAAQADIILNAGKLAGGVGSTVADVSENRLNILREGAVSAAELTAALEAY